MYDLFSFEFSRNILNVEMSICVATSSQIGSSGGGGGAFDAALGTYIYTRYDSNI